MISGLIWFILGFVMGLTTLAVITAILGEV